MHPSARFVLGIDTVSLIGTLCELGDVRHLDELGSSGPLTASAGEESWFRCLFGRDALRTSIDLLDDFPNLARSTLIELARLQGVRENPRGEEQPGRILHEHRYSHDPFAAVLKRQWDLPYYGAIDTTPLWINALVAYCTARRDRSILKIALTNRGRRRVSVLDSLLAALGWLQRRLDDPRGGGFLWSQSALPMGLVNQVWEDSFDAYYFPDGRLIDPRCARAPVSVQACAYDALIGAADLLEAEWQSQPAGDVEHLRLRAHALRADVLAQFWCPDHRTFAHALVLEPDGAHQTCVIASAPGHLLASQLLDGDDAAQIREQVAERLIEPDLLACAGVRTKSTSSARYRAGSYHNGSTWPWDTGVIADGLRRHGYAATADDLEDRILAACAQASGFPEFFRGDADRVAINTGTVDEFVDGSVNRLEQPPQARQAWTATRVWRILRSRGWQLASVPHRGLA